MQGEQAAEPTSPRLQIRQNVQSANTNPEAFEVVNVSIGLRLFGTGNSKLFARSD
jgi:hypothetical protein